MKLLLGCKNIKPWLRNKHNVYGEYHCFPEKVIAAQYLNGKVIGECDFEVEEINTWKCPNIDGGYPIYNTKTLNHEKIREKSCLTDIQLEEYFGYNNGYAINLKNLHIFDKPRELDDYYSNKELMLEILKVWENFGLPDIDDYKEASFKQFPKNMCYAYDEKESYIFLPVEPEEACRILKGLQTIIIRKTILKDMIK